MYFSIILGDQIHEVCVCVCGAGWLGERCVREYIGVGASVRSCARARVCGLCLIIIIFCY